MAQLQDKTVALAGRDLTEIIKTGKRELIREFLLILVYLEVVLGQSLADVVAKFPAKEVNLAEFRSFFGGK